MSLNPTLQIINHMLGRKYHKATPFEASRQASAQRITKASDSRASFGNHPALTNLRMLTTAAERFGIGNPFFKLHEGVGGHHTNIGGKQYLNFSHYSYLGLNGHPEVNEAAQKAIDSYGTSAGASRLVAGERPVQRQLEEALAAVYGVEDCLAFVSGHATNVSTISTLFGHNDLIIHDSLIHNSVLEGIRLSGATRRPFPHNDLKALENLLASLRSRFERVCIIVEGVYSMDGDMPDLPALVRIKLKYDAFLMVDEAHSLGVLGATGKGLAEYWGLPGTDVDIWMGTLSKTLAGCGGYIAGSRDMVEILKFSAPGFVYSVGLSPPLAAASLEALRIMQREPDRVRCLHDRSSLFLGLARESGLDVGTSQGFSIVPVILGSSRKAVALSNQLFEHGINVQPIIHPAVEEKAARLRFFLSAMHTEEEIRRTCQTMALLAHGKDVSHAL